MKLFKHLTLLTFFVISTPVLCNAGGTRGGGGDSSAEQAAYRKGLVGFIRLDLGNRVISLLTSIDADKIKNQEIQKYIKQMQKGDALKKDIVELKDKMYSPKDSCENGKDEYAIGQRKTPICFSLDKLSQDISKNSLNSIVMLALHAHAHQFGWALTEKGEEEHAHSLAQALTPDVIKDVSNSNLKVAVTAPQSTSVPEEPKILYSANIDPDKSGMDYMTAQSICEQQKLLFQNTYFFVYCIYHEKSWSEVRYDTVFYVSARMWWYESYAPYTYQYSVDVQIYGLEVIGLGDFLTAPTSVVFDSRFYANDIAYAWTFASEHEAFMFCGYFLAHQQQDLKYTRGFCEARPSDDGRFYFEIKTKNPLLSGSVLK